MGNTSTKERASSPPDRQAHLGSNSRPRPGRNNGESSSRLSPFGGSHDGFPHRSSRSRNIDGSFLGLGVTSREVRERDREAREAEKVTREQRRKEREAERKQERERSLREESVDGGFLVTQGVYTGPEDFKDRIVRQFMVERRLAPFFKGLRDYQGDWTDAQLFAAFHGLEIPGSDAEPPKDPNEQKAIDSSDILAIPSTSRSRSQSYASETSSRSNTPITPYFSFSAPRSRSKTLSISLPKNPTITNSATPLEINNASRFVDGRPIEAALYKNAAECPICFMYYPPYLNRTRCCDQEICSECFVQIKRADPHIPDNHDNSDENQQEQNSMANQLSSEPATCPFCKQTDFGVTYNPPPWRRGISLVHQSSSPISSALDTGSEAPCSPFGESNQSSQPTSPAVTPSWKRRTMLPLTAPEVITTDKIRPDWSMKLANARSHAARRAAAATALHTAAFLMGNNSNSSPGGYGRLIRRAVSGSTGGRAGSESPSPNTSGAETPRDEATRPGGLLGLGVLGGGRERERDRDARSRDPSVEERLSSLGFISRRDAVSPGSRTERRSRIVDLEEMMFMEAIRLSLAEDEERKRREAEREKEKQVDNSEEAQEADIPMREGSIGMSDRKGKTVDRSDLSSGGASSTSPLASTTTLSGSDSGSSGFVSTYIREGSGCGTPGNDDGENASSPEDCMFNFSSLAAMISTDEDELRPGQEIEHEHGPAVVVDDRPSVSGQQFSKDGGTVIGTIARETS